MSYMFRPHRYLLRRGIFASFYLLLHPYHKIGYVKLCTSCISVLLNVGLLNVNF